MIKKENKLVPVLCDIDSDSLVSKEYSKKITMEEEY